MPEKFYVDPTNQVPLMCACNISDTKLKSIKQNVLSAAFYYGKVSEKDHFKIFGRAARDAKTRTFLFRDEIREDCKSRLWVLAMVKELVQPVYGQRDLKKAFPVSVRYSIVDVLFFDSIIHWLSCWLGHSSPNRSLNPIIQTTKDICIGYSYAFYFCSRVRFKVNPFSIFVKPIFA